MRAKWMRRLGVAALTGAVGWSSIGCAQERDPINQVQADALDKHFFVGASLNDTSDDPEFYMRDTVVDVPYGDQNGLFTAYDSQPLTRIKWEIQENNLIARETYEHITDSDHHGSKTSNNGQIVGMWTITSHFDIRRSYNPQTGEEMNIITENSTDRPWYEREYMRVDWSKNLITDAYSLDTLSAAGMFGTVKFDPEAYYVQDPTDPNAPTFDADNGYFDVTTKALATPQMLNFPQWGISLPACLIADGKFTFPPDDSTTTNCNPTELTLRLSFRKVVDDDYEPEDWDGNMMQAFGWFTVDRLGYNRNYGILDEDWHRFAAKYNIWQKSHIEGSQCATDYWRDANGNIVNYKVDSNGNFLTDSDTGLPIPDPNGKPHPGTVIGSNIHADNDGDGTEDECQFVNAAGNVTHPGSRCDQFSHKCDLPLHERQIKTIPWYFGADGAPDLFASTARALNEWNVAVLRAAMIGQNVEANRVGGTSPVTMDVSTEDMLVADQAPGGPATVKPVFTLCHNPSIETDNEACFKHNSAGELLHGADGKPIMVLARLGDIRYNFVDMVPNPQTDSPWGIMVDANDPLTGEKVTTSVNEWASVLDYAAQGTEDLLRWINGEITDDQIVSGQYLKDWVNASKLGTAQYQPKTLSKAQIADAMSAITNPTLKANGADTHALAKMTPSQRADIFEAGIKQAASLGPSLDATFEGNRQLLLGSKFETQLMTPMQVQRAGFDPTATSLADNPTVVERASPLRSLNPMVRRWLQKTKDKYANYSARCEIEQPEPDALVGLARQAQRLYPLPQDAPQGSPGYAALNDPNYAPLKAARDKALHQWIREQFNVSVIAHEMGHSMGLRHNFTGSWDAMNYKTQYWQLRTRNGAEKPCSDATTPHVDGNDCSGPRWIDPVTDAETNGMIWKWGSTTVMDYPGDQTQDMNDIGNYDKAAMRFGYADVVDVDKNEKLATGVLYQGRLDGFGGISGPFDFVGQGSIHYTQFPQYIDELGTCTAQTDPNDLLSSKCTGTPLDFIARRDMRDIPNANPNQYKYWAVDSQGRTRHPYMFGSDEYADTGNVPVFRFDAGADPYEQEQFLISTYENRYIFNNFRRDHVQFNTDAVMSRTEGRYFDKFTSSYKALALYLELEPQQFHAELLNGPGLLMAHNIAASLSMAEFAKIITRPEPGQYVLENGVAQVAASSDVTPPDPVFQIAIGSGEGRYINNDYDYSKGYWWGDYQTQVGSYYEKVDTVYYLTEAYNQFVQNNKDDYIDGRYLNINYSTLYPDQMRRFFSGLMQNDLTTFGPYVSMPTQGNQSTLPTAQVQYLPWETGTTQVNYPANTTVLNPLVGWEEQFPGAIYGMYFGGTTLTQDWTDQMRIYSMGGGSDSITIPTEQQVVYDDPTSGIEYVARDYGTENIAGHNVRRTSGARMLQYASDLAKATFTTVSTGPRQGEAKYNFDSNGNAVCISPGDACEAARQTLRKFSSNIDTVRELSSWFGYGPINNR